MCVYGMNPIPVCPFARYVLVSERRISNKYCSCYYILYSVDFHQSPRSAASDLGLHYLSMSLLRDARHKWFNASIFLPFFSGPKLGTRLSVNTNKLLFKIRLHSLNSTSLACVFKWYRLALLEFTEVKN